MSTLLATQWREPKAADPSAVTTLASQLKLPEPLCAILVARGFADSASAKRFLRPTLDQLHDPADLADLGPALERLDHAIRRGEVILVHGDYDVDGVCAAALYTHVLRQLGARVVPFVPHRTRDGYDLSAAGVRRAAEADAKLILTADCGIVAHEAVDAARAAGIDVVVTDHHVPGPDLPCAVALVDPRRADCRYPNKSLSGTGVAFKVAHALARARGVEDKDVLYHLDLVALATVADVMPMTGENRVLTAFGMRVLRQSRNAGLRALVRTVGLESRLLATGHLSHVLAPRLNAIGRLADAATGLDLLLSDDGRSQAIATRLEEANRERQAVDRDILARALEQLEGRYDAVRDRSLVIAGEGWHPGVIGIVASRLVERFHRPTILIARGENGALARGSARSIPGFDLLAAIRACGAHLERFGGHAAAAGFDVRPDRIDAFARAFEQEARSRLPEPPISELRVDLELPLSEITPELARYLRYLGPFGIGNPTPVFVARNVHVREARAVGVDGRHLRLLLEDGDARVPAIGFRMADTHGPVARVGEVLDVAFQLQEDVFRGRRRIQAKLVDLRPRAA